MNWHGIAAILRFEMARFFRSIIQSIVSPVLSTSLYFVVFGAAIGSRIPEIEGVTYGAFIVPGLIMLTVLQQAIQNAGFGIYFPKFIGTIFEVLSAPLSPFEIVIGYVGAAAVKALLIGCIILEALVSSGANLTVVEMGNRMVPRMLDETCGTMLENWCREKGVNVMTSSQVEAIEDAGDHVKVKISGDREYETRGRWSVRYRSPDALGVGE